MPQKKNPDLAELIRGKSARVIANYQSVITMMKSLPLSYNRDMQEDKQPVFESFYILSSSLKILTSMVNSVKFDNSKLFESIKDGFMLSTDLADWLVKKGIPFGEAHNLIGELINLAFSKNKELKDLTLDEFKSVSKIFDQSIFKILEINSSLRNKVTIGSPNPSLVKKQIKKWQKKIAIS